MDYEKILKNARLEESKSLVKVYESKYYEALTDSLYLMEEAEQISVLNRMTEKALFGSMDSQVKKMVKQINIAKKASSELKNAIKSEPDFNDDENLIDLYQNINNLSNECEDILKALKDPKFVGNYTIIDNNTGLFGRNKGNGLSSKDFNNQQSTNELDNNETTQKVQKEFTESWYNIKSRVDKLQQDYKQKIIPLANKFHKDSKFSGALKKLGGTMAAIGGIISIAGKIASFINPAVGAALTTGGLALGGTGTLLNRGTSSVQKFKRGNWKQGVADAGMALLGGATAFGAGKSFLGNLETSTGKIGQDQISNASNVDRDNQPVYKNPYQSQVGTGSSNQVNNIPQQAESPKFEPTPITKVEPTPPNTDGGYNLDKYLNDSKENLDSYLANSSNNTDTYLSDSQKNLDAYLNGDISRDEYNTNLANLRAIHNNNRSSFGSTYDNNQDSYRTLFDNSRRK